MFLGHYWWVDLVGMSTPSFTVSPDTDFNLQTHMIPASLLEPVQTDLQSMMMMMESSSVDHFVGGDMGRGVEQYGCDLMESASGSLFRYIYICKYVYTV